MLPVKTLKNQFRGINPHLHNTCQKYGGWIEFHNRHVVHLATTLTAQLRPMGYRASIEQSVQDCRRILTDTAKHTAPVF